MCLILLIQALLLVVFSLSAVLTLCAEPHGDCECPCLPERDAPPHRAVFRIAAEARLHSDDQEGLT